MGNILPIGLRQATRKWIVEIIIFIRHRQGLLKARRYRRSTHLKLHLGCGNQLKAGWINIDIMASADLFLDLREPLPFADNSCQIIYSEHFLEHLDYPESAVSLVKESYRVLETGGVFSVVVPDIEIVLHAYVNGGDSEYYAAQKHFHPAYCQTQMEHINYNFRQQGEHKFAYDFETMHKLLASCGFKQISRRELDPTLDNIDRKVGSLYVSAIK